MQPEQNETRRIPLPESRRHPFRAIVFVIVACALLLIAYWLVGSGTFDSTLDSHLSQLTQGLLASFVVAILVVSYLGARREPPFSETPSARTLPRRHERVLRHAQWFVQMRWVAAAVSLALIVIAVFVAEILSQTALVPLLGWWLVFVAANVWFARRLRWVKDLEREIVLQAVVDLVVLTGWLNASGGIENPFYQVYILHVIIAGILLPRRKAFFVTVLACLLTTFLAAGEYFRIVPHETISVFPHADEESEHTHTEGGTLHASLDPTFVLGRMIPFLATLNLVAYLTSIISDRLRRSEDELEEAARTEALERRRLEGVIHSAGIGVVVLDPDLTLQWYSGRAAEWLELDSKSIGQICSASENGSDAGCLVVETAQRASPLETERTVKAPGGEVRHFRHATWPVVDGEGRVHQVVKLVQDITSQKALEAEAVHAGKLSALGKMAAAVAHEINNPLASLAGRLALMERNQDPEFLRESLGVLRGQIGRIGRIVHTVSQFSRAPVKGRTTWDVNAAVNEALGLVKLDPRSSQKRFEWRPPATQLLVNAVRDQILQAYLNLLLNAVEASPNGGEVTVRAFATNGEVGVAFEDSGEGIDASMTAHLFEPFATTKPMGIGIGLAISKSFVNAHGGRIEVVSDPAKGSCFTVLLPAADTAAGTHSNAVTHS